MDKTGVGGNPPTAYACAGQDRVWYFSDELEPDIDWFHANEPIWAPRRVIGEFLYENENFLLDPADERLEIHLGSQLDEIAELRPYEITFHIVLVQHSKGASKVKLSKFKKAVNSRTNFRIEYHEFPADFTQIPTPTEVFLAGDYLAELRVAGLGQRYLAFRNLPTAARQLNEARLSIENLVSDTSIISQAEPIPIGSSTFFRVILENRQIVMVRGWPNRASLLVTDSNSNFPVLPLTSSSSFDRNQCAGWMSSQKNFVV